MDEIETQVANWLAVQTLPDNHPKLLYMARNTVDPNIIHAIAVKIGEELRQWATVDYVQLILNVLLWDKRETEERTLDYIIKYVPFCSGTVIAEMRQAVGDERWFAMSEEERYELCEAWRDDQDPPLDGE